MRTFIFVTFFAFNLAHSQEYFGLSIARKPNEIRPALFGERKDKWISVQPNFLTFTIVPHDPYNGDRTSLSMYPALWMGSRIVQSILTGGGREWLPRNGLIPDSTFFWFFIQDLVLAGALVNSELHYNLAPWDSTVTSTFLPSVFLGLQTDYFLKAKNWIRISPAIGFELGTVFPGDKRRPTIALQIGVDMPCDFGNKVRRIGPFGGFGAIKGYLYL